MNFYYWLSSILSFGYICLMPLLIIAWLILKKHRERIMQFVAVANGWFCVYNILFLGNWIIGFLLIWYEQYQYEGYDYYYSSMNVFSPYGFIFRLQFVPVLLSLLFFWKGFRRKIRFSILILLLLVITNERLIIYISRFYSDYLPSSWSVEPKAKDWWENNFFCLFCYLLIIAVTYYWQQKRKLSTHPYS